MFPREVGTVFALYSCGFFIYQMVLDGETIFGSNKNRRGQNSWNHRAEKGVVE